MSYFVTLIVFPSFLLFLWLPAIIFHMSVDVAIETSWFPVFVVVVFRLSNVYKCFFPFVSNFWSCPIVLYPCPTNMITTFHFLSIFGAIMGRYSNIILIMLLLIFFFSKNIACMLLVSVFIANTSNSIIKSMMCFFSYLNVIIFHSAYATLLLSLNAVLISLTKSSQS